MESEFKFLYKTVIGASSIARNYINSPGILKNKDKDIKTKVDVDVNNFIINNLSKTGIPILSEESDNNAISLNDDIWIVDPLDGTLNFTRKFPISPIYIALFKKGKPHFGKTKMRKDEVMELYPDILKTKKEFKWKPETGLKEGLQKTIKFYEQK